MPDRDVRQPAQGGVHHHGMGAGVIVGVVLALVAVLLVVLFAVGALDSGSGGEAEAPGIDLELD